jgi:carboxyl-terminal processing protease
VRLQILKAGESESSPPYELRLVRDKVHLQDQTAQSDTLYIEHNGTNYTIGVIQIPAFYFNLEGYRKRDPNYESTTRDVERLLKQFEDIDGVIIDLRRNGGGFLSEAISLTGLFIEDGPVVQVRDAVGRIKIEEDYDSKLVYDGPLAVLVDQFSASASEIFAAAIQDYGRGIILGNQTFGKGTVQNAIDLSRYFPNSKNRYGQLKLTIAKFYRVSGGSTQHVGVIPDVELPSRFKHEEIGESSHKNALLWDQIDATKIQNFQKNNTLIQDLEKLHAIRISSDPEFDEFIQKIEDNKKAREKKLISLNEEVRKNEREASKKTNKDEGEHKQEKNEDLLLTESAYILSDYISLIHNR